ncbi:GDSL esterase/lipase [Dichanthelium oligosanthes]|uniref:GDSL esterase/lipase n=1 Tax=Dichanthelium oligosanthes TaxID=888268 RepID=A0A1E5UWY2_9POAL|nr:GDSL esterase/lipase [Dichanthelium oligosanthes]
MRLSVVLLAVSLLCLYGSGGRVAASTDFNFPAVFNFGDSNSDTGGRVAAGFESIFPPYGSTFFGGPAGRFCDGRLILDYLSALASRSHSLVLVLSFLNSPVSTIKLEAMDMPLLNAYLDSLGTPNFRTGVNFAQAGCSITPAKPTSVSPFSFGLQVKQFFAFKDKVIKLLSKGDMYRQYIPQEDYFSEGLYMFDIGQNDLAGEFYSKTEEQVIASIPTILLEFETGLKLRGEFAGASITYVDIHTIKYNLIANYSRYGFEHATQACCGYGGPPLNYDGNVPCGHTVSLNGKLVTAKGCSDSTEFVNWDGIHYTEASNFHVASQILTGKYSDPPFVVKMPFVIKPRF